MGEYESTGNDENKKYDEIRAMASKNWLSSASVSLAKLDEVKAKVYNMGLTDPSNLKPKSGSKACSKDESNSSRTTTTRWASSEPPLSRVVMQNNAWCTSVAVPTNAPRVRQQCEQQKFRTRPESAKNQNGAKVQLKRRPHSAVIAGVSSIRTNPKDTELSDLLIQDEVEEGQSVLGVHGAKCDPEERPDHFSVHQSSVGYVAGSKPDTRRGSSQQEVPSTDHENRGHEMLHNRQVVVQIPLEVEDTDLPPAPCTSPDLTQFKDGELENGLQGSVEAHTSSQTMYINIPHDKAVDTFSLPGHEYEPWSGNEEEVETQIEAEGATENTAVGSHPEILTSPKVFIGSNAEKTEFSALSEELNQEVQELKQELQRYSHRSCDTKQILKQRPKSGKNTVQFDEQSNMTIKITPRMKPTDETNHGSDAWPQPYTGGRWDLRHVQSRTNSGIKLSKTYARINSKVRRPQSAHTESGVKGKGSNKSSAKVPTVSVAYLEDSDSEGEESKRKPGQKSVSSKVGDNRRSCDVDTLVSKVDKTKGQRDDSTNNLDLQVKGNHDLGNESQGQVEGESDETDLDLSNSRPLSRSGSPTKCVSSSEKNYYQLAIKKTGAKQTKGAEPSGLIDGGVMQEEQELRKTVKTLELLDGKELKEMKIISTIGAQEHRTKDYVAPRPTSASRVFSAQKSETSDKPATKKIPSKVHEKPPSQLTQSHVNSRPQSAIKKVDRTQRDMKNKQAKTLVERQETNESSALFSDDQLEEELNRLVQQEEGATQEVIHTAGFTMTEEERPSSRMGFRSDEGIVGKQISTEAKTIGGLQKRRVNSASERLERHLGDTRATNLSSIKSRPLSSHLNSEKEVNSNCSCGRHKMEQAKASSTQGQRKSSVTDILAKTNNFKGCGNLTANKLDVKKGSRKELPTSEVVEIWTRKDDYALDTDGMKECREIQAQLIDSGVPVSIYALKRALLPPTEYNWKGPSYKSNVTAIHPQYNTSAGLLSKPETWLPEEYQKVKEAQRKVRVATEMLLEQEREQRELEYTASMRKRKTSGKKRKSTKKK